VRLLTLVALAFGRTCRFSIRPADDIAVVTFHTDRPGGPCLSGGPEEYEGECVCVVDL
jgi:hypothetical protein